MSYHRNEVFVCHMSHAGLCHTTISMSLSMISIMITHSSSQEDPSVLLAEYETAASTGFQHGVMDLMQRYVKTLHLMPFAAAYTHIHVIETCLYCRYDAFRRVRGDGDCFFRSYIFSLLEEMLYGLKRGDAQVKKAHAGLIERVKGSKELLLQQNYQEVVR